MSAYVRVVGDGLLGHKTRVFFVANNGAETEITSVVRAVHIDMAVSDTNSGTLDVIAIEVAGAQP